MDEIQLDPLMLTTKLYDATLIGDVNSLINLLRHDPLILDRCIIEKSDRFIQSPLHIASDLGHIEFTTQLLNLKPELARQLDWSTRSSALHLASAKGHLDIVKKLVEVNPNMCLARDQDGLNPVHVAAVNGQLHVLDVLVRTNPLADRERTNSGDSILHLCLKYEQVDSLKYLVNAIDDSELLNSTDNHNNTVLHLAVVAKQLEIVKFLVKNKKLQQNAINKNGLTALEWLIQNNGKSQNNEEIMKTLKRAKALEPNRAAKQKDKHAKWLKKQSNALMVVASLIATMAFQIGVNPPGGAWQDDSNPNNSSGQIPHLVGTSIMANRDPDTYKNLQNVNTISLVSSLSVVLLLISGIPCKRLFVVLLMIIMWVAITTTTLSYYYSLSYLTKKAHGGSGPHGEGSRSDVSGGALSWLVAWAILVVLGFVIRVLFQPMKRTVLHLRKTLSKLFNKDQEPYANVPP
ncbi:uncharacterized protein LOC141612161 [Silene latifolia]|uniref:uncharacterized protein LOC141612161 n=1 Tax=Silene latifolia TaxID=37657 RepID=UPI003D7889A8